MSDFLYNTASEILNKLGSTALETFGTMWNIDDELLRLKNTVSRIRAVLLDAEEQQATSHVVQDWVERLQDVFYKADDLLDDFSTEVLRKEIDGNKRSKVSTVFSSLKSIPYNFKISGQVKEIRESLEAILDEKTNFHFTERNPQQMPMKRKREETHSFVHVEDVIGRDNDKREVIDLLLNENVQKNVDVISIVGIGGLGKTTLAKLVYNDDAVKNQFNLKIWVCVYDAFDVKNIAQNIVNSTGQNFQMDQIQSQVREKVNGKKYLLVLDDMWNEDRMKWLELESLLRGGVRGSKILVTTRAEVVAKAMGTSLYNLKGLSEDESWFLFKKMAFEEEQDMNTRLVVIGKDILKKCSGVPLVIRTLGSLLYNEKTEAEWSRIKDIDIPKDDIIPILKLSYDYLPSHLKQCFAYCSLYPKDHTIYKKHLIDLWMAQGFVKSLDEKDNLEDAGNSYFMDLLKRSFFQDVDKDYLGDILCCKMHDLMHDLAQSVAGSENSVSRLDAKNITRRSRHVSIDASEFIDETLTPFFRAKEARSFLLQHHFRLDASMVNNIISSFRRLRVLDLLSTGMEMVPEYIGDLKHLRYLDMSWNKFSNLPSSVTKLQNLQTLYLIGCRNLVELPSGFERLVSLRHLNLTGCHSLTRMPCGIGQLTSLRTLPQFVVGKDEDDSSLSTLIGLNNLREKLVIERLGCLRNSTIEEVLEDASYLKGKEYLQGLRLKWDLDYSVVNTTDDESILEALQPHPNLKKISFEFYMGVYWPNWMMMQHNPGESPLPNLELIHLYYCKRFQHLPLMFGELPSLRYLYIVTCVKLRSLSKGGGLQGLTSLQTLVIEDCNELDLSEDDDNNKGMQLFQGLRSLTFLRIDNVPKLLSIPAGLQHITTLQSLEITNCTNLSSLPEWIGSLISLQNLIIRDNPKLASLPQGMIRLTTLQKLDIEDSPQLEEKCQRETGEDWPKIAHIPYVHGRNLVFS